MTVLLVHNFYQTKSVGGEDIVFQNETEALKHALGPDSVLTYTVNNDGLRPWALVFSVWFSVTHFFRILRLVRREKIDLVHVHNFFPLLTGSVFLAARLGGAKVVHTLHSFRFWCISGIFYRSEVGICELCTTKNHRWSSVRFGCYRDSRLQTVLAQGAFSFYKAIGVFQWIDQFIVLTRFQRAKLLGLGVAEDRMFLKPNHMTGQLTAGSPRRERRGFLYVGRLEVSKGILQVLEAWRKLDFRYQLSVIGSGELETSIANDYELENVKFLGKMSHDQVMAAIGTSQYLIQSSLLYETFGLTILEAMSLAVPVIGFSIGTRPEFIEDGKNGFLCDPDALVTTLERALNNPNYEEMCNAALKTGLDFREEKLVALQLECYQKLIEDRT